MKLSKVVRKIESNFPISWAEDWDYPGLIAGDPWANIDFIMLALDPSPGVVEEAANKGADMLLTHHPPSLKPVSRLVKGDPEGGAVYQAIEKGIALYALHTALDISPISPSFALAKHLNLLDTEVLAPRDKGQLLKLVCFVPDSDYDRVREAVSEAGAGSIGKYSECTFSSKGEGTFKPGAGSSPHIGKRGELTRVKEKRFETILPRHRLSAVLSAMEDAHPYEEVAYDIYRLENEAGSIGYGALGYLSRPRGVVELVEELKSYLPASSVNLCGRPETKVSRVAILGGSGADFLDVAESRGADVLITGEVGYHRLRYAEALGLATVVVGHFASEWIALPLLKDELAKMVWEHPGQGVIDIADTEHDPLWNA